MTMQQLLYAIEVYRAGSINRAAQRLYITQPTLSNIIKGLEDEINITLFQRTSRGIVMTPAGEQFIEQAIKLTSQFSAFEKMYEEKENSVLSLSITVARSSEFSNCITDYLNDCVKCGAPCRIRLREATNSEVIDDTSSGDADLGIICPSSSASDYYFQTARSRGLEIINLKPKRYCLLFSKDHPLARENVITAQMLEPFIEVVHADYDIPIYPSSDYNYLQTPNEIGKKKRVIFIYERGTLMEVLANVHGSYMWSTTTNHRLKDAYGLVERVCSAPPVEGKDAILYNRSSPLSAELKGLIRAIQIYDAQLDDTAIQ